MSWKYEMNRITFGGGPSRSRGISCKNEMEAVNSLKHYFAFKHNKGKCASCRDER